MDKKLEQFTDQQYLNLETFRRTGVGVKTPVWFTADEGKLYIRTVADSGKIKRIRHTARVRLTPSDMRGTPVGEWVDGQARLVDGVVSNRVNDLLKRKYGLFKRVFDLMQGFRKTSYATIEIELV